MQSCRFANLTCCVTGSPRVIKTIFGSSHSTCISRQQNSCTCEHGEWNGNGFPNNSGSAECYPVSQREHHLSPNSLYILSQASFRDLNPIMFLLFDNNNASWSGYPLSSWLSSSALHIEVPSRPGNHLQQLAICAAEWVNAANKIPAAVKGSGRTHA